MQKPPKFGRLLGETFTEMNKALERKLKEHSLPVTAEQFRVMTVLWEEDGITQAQLAIKARRDRAAITRITDLLEEKGLVRRISHPADKRVNLLTLTSSGKALQAPALRAGGEAVNQGLLGFSEEEEALLRQFLMRIQQNFRDSSAEEA